MEKVYVVTCPENGWDCVVSVYLANNEQEVINFIMIEKGVTEEWIENNYVISGKRITKIK